MGKLRHISKQERVKQLEEKQIKEMALQEAMKKSHKKQNLAVFLQQFEQNTTLSSTNRINNSIATLCLTFGKGKNDRQQNLAKHYSYRAFKALLLHLEKCNCQKLIENNEYLNGLYAVAHFAHDYVRELATWKATSHNIQRQFSSLLQHLFGKYSVPQFLESVWFQNGNWTHRKWYVQIARGESVRSLEKLPPNFTKRMMHEFLKAPNYCTVPEALRYAQTVSFGGDARFAWYVNRSLLGRNKFVNDAFWQTVIAFFAKVSMFDYEQFDAICDYIKVQKYGHDYTENYQRLVRELPAQPNFEMKGRTVESLLRQTQEWHTALTKRRRKQELRWIKSTVKDAEFVTGGDYNEKLYTFTELLTTTQLSIEGTAMHHCVATYDVACLQGRSAIFSLTTASHVTKPTRLATIEVALGNRQIVQIKGKYNSKVEPSTHEMIKRWAIQENLSFSKWIDTF